MVQAEQHAFSSADITNALFFKLFVGGAAAALVAIILCCRVRSSVCFSRAAAIASASTVSSKVSYRWVKDVITNSGVRVRVTGLGLRGQ